MLHPSERLGMYNPVTVSLEIRSDITLILFPVAPQTFVAKSRTAPEHLMLLLFRKFPDKH
jgi:hypothetical protein